MLIWVLCFCGETAYHDAEHIVGLRYSPHKGWKEGEKEEASLGHTYSTRSHFL